MFLPVLTCVIALNTASGARVARRADREKMFAWLSTLGLPDVRRLQFQRIEGHPESAKVPPRYGHGSLVRKEWSKVIVIGLDLVPVEIPKPRYSAQTWREIVRLLTPALNDTAIRWNGSSFQSTDWMLSDTAMRALIRWDPERFQRPANRKREYTIPASLPRGFSNREFMRLERKSVT